jgi:hypothetical protein
MADEAEAGAAAGFKGVRYAAGALLLLLFFCCGWHLH